MATMLSIIQQAAGEMGLSVPTFVAGNTAQDTIQQLALLNGLGAELAREYDWQRLQTEYRFFTQYTATTGNTVAGSYQITGIPSTAGLSNTYMVLGVGINTDVFVVSVDSPTQVTVSQPAASTGTGVTLNFCQARYTLPSDWDRTIDRTQWDKSKRWELLGPQTPQQWQWVKSGYISTGPRIRWRLQNNYFEIYPPVATNEFVGYEYISSNWAAAQDGTAKSSLTVDTDTTVFPDRLMVAGLMHKYFTVKGFGPIYLSDFQRQLDIAKANDKGSAILSMAPNASQVLIGVSNIPDSGYGGVVG